MKKSFFILLTLIFISFTILGASASEFYDTTNIEHLFTHCLVAYPEIAFNKNNPMRNNYNIDCITSYEFSQILESLYKNNYILVDINKTFKITKNGAEKTKLRVPKGKKALILSFDDVNYDHKKMGLGMVDKIVLDNLGNIATQTNINGKIDISYDKEFVNILDNFVTQHPDFSLCGAKGTINLTGYDGIFGYRTQAKNTKTRQSEIIKARKIAKKLKQNGWNFASHSYGHYHMNKISDEEFEQELKAWREEVEPIVGKTKVYVYPYGEWSVYENDKLCEKHQLLKKYGFEIFCGVGMQTFYSYLPTKSNEKVLFMDRKCVDGSTLKKCDKYLLPFFNPKSVYDYISRPASFIYSIQTIK